MAIKIFLRAPYNYDADAVSRENGFDCGDPKNSVTQQSFKDECDINEIVRRFGLTGEMPGDFAMPVSGDFTGVIDFQSAMNLVVAAQEEFMRVPADVRARFNNDPARLMAFLEDGRNYDEALKLGLVVTRVEKDRVGVPVADVGGKS